MAVFAYKGRAGGRSVADEIEADSRPAAVAALRAKGIVATAVREKQGKAAAAAPTASGGKKFGGKVKDKQLAIYTRQFSTMVDAGLPIAQSLQGGSTLAESFGKYPKTFDNLFVNMLAVGESGGVLDVVLQRLSGYIEKAAKLKAKVDRGTGRIVRAGG